MKDIFGYLARSSKALKKHIFTYLLFLLVPILFLGLLFYFKLSLEIKNDFENLYINKANSTAKYFEMQFKELDKIGVNLSFNKNVYPFNKKEFKHYTNSEVDNLILQLSNAVAHIDIIDDIFLYLYNEEILPSSRGIIPLNMFLNSILNIDQEISGNILNTIKTQNDTKILKYKLDDSYLDFSRKYRLSFDYNALYLYPITLYPVTMSSGEIYGNIIFIMNLNNIFLELGNLIGDEQGCVFILNQDNEVLFKFEKGDISNLNLQEKDIVNSINKNINKYTKSDTYSHINVISPSYNFKYVFAFSQSLPMENINALRKMIIKWVSFGSLISLMLSYIISAISYKPIKTIASIIQKNGNLDKKNNDYKGEIPSDIENIKLELLNMLNEKEHLAKTVFSQMPYVQDQIVSQALKGKSINERNYKELFNFFKIPLDRNFYSVVFIKFSTNNYSNATMYLQQIMYAIFNSFIEDPKLKCYCIESFDNNIITILNSDDEYIISNKTQKILENIQNNLKIQFRVDTHIGISSVCNNLANLHKCFLEALSASHFREYKSNYSIVYYNSITDKRKYEYWYPQEEHEALIRSVNKADFKMAKKQISNIIHSVREKDMPFEMAHCICFSIIKAILDLFNGYNLNIQESEIELSLKFSSLQELQIRLENLIENICKQLTIKKQDGKDKLKSKALEFILNEYKDKEMTIAKLSEKLKVSPQYLSKYLKENTGLRYTELIRNVRIREAKKLLSETDMPIKAITLEVGYTSISSFIRRFKEEEGITPNEYRNLIWEK